MKYDFVAPLIEIIFTERFLTLISIHWGSHTNTYQSGWNRRRKKSSGYPSNIYLFKVKNRNTSKRCKICSNLTIKTSEPRQRRQRRRSGVFIVKLEHISLFILVFLLLTLNRYIVNVIWVCLWHNISINF